MVTPMRRLSLAVVAVVVITMTGASLGGSAASAKPRQPDCRHFFTHRQIVNALGGSAAITSLQKARASAIYGSEIPTGTNCGYLWDTSTNPPAGYPMCSLNSLGRFANYSPGYGWIVAPRLHGQAVEAPDAHPEEHGRCSGSEPRSDTEVPLDQAGAQEPGLLYLRQDYCNPDGTSGAYALYVPTRTATTS